MKVEATALPGVIIIEPRVFPDDRGVFLETWSQERYAQAGVPQKFVQDNLSVSGRGVVRGLHYQEPNAQGKLLTVLDGEIFDVAVDIRHDSPTFKQWVGVTLSAENRRQLYVPAGFAHGFQAVSASATVLYKCTDYYNHESEQSIRWSDSELAIEWPLPPVLSEKDRSAPRLRDIPQDQLPEYSPT